jgi:twinkle protein
MGQLLKMGLSCPKCGSTDAGMIYKNRNPETQQDFYLFSCNSSKHDQTDGVWAMPIVDPDNHEEEITSKLNGTFQMDEDTVVDAPAQEDHVIGLIEGGEYLTLNNAKHPWGIRHITADTCKRFGVKYKELPFSRNQYIAHKAEAAGLTVYQPAMIFPNFDEKGKLIGQKVRSLNPITGERTFDWYKATEQFSAQRTFFGQNLWLSEKYHGKKLVITFGEFDAMALYQMTGEQYCVISVPDGDTSLRVLAERYYNWMNKFSEIIFVPDNDPSGGCLKCVQPIAAKFPRKAKIVNLVKYKDPCDYLANSDLQTFREEFFSAQAFTPQNIVPLSSQKRLLLEDPPKPVADYPFEGMNKMLGGIWPGELVTLKARPGQGKSSLMNEIAHHLFKTTDARVGMIYLEESKRDLVFRLVGMELNQNMKLKGTNLQDPSIALAFDTLTQPERFFIVDHWGACSSDFIEEKITELVLASGCQFIFFDHISMAITDETNKDERIALDRLIASIKALTVGMLDYDDAGKPIERHPTIFMVTHVNDDGKPRGSRAALQLSNTVIDLERDATAKSEVERNTLRVTVEKNRQLGETGVASLLYYTKETARLTEIQEGDQMPEDAKDTPVMDNTRLGQEMANTKPYFVVGKNYVATKKDGKN